MKRRITSLMLAVSLLLSAVPMPAFATEESHGLCEHHAAHTEECGYVPAVEAKECGHVCTEDCQQPIVECVHEHGDECWQPGVDGGDPVLECVHTECTVQSGCVAADIFCVHQHGDECWQIGGEDEDPVLNCIHTECTVESGCATVKLVCNHEHDASCGYTEGSMEVPCSYECEICNSIETGFCAHGNGIESCELCQLETLIGSLPTYEELGVLEGDAYVSALSAVQNAQVTYYGLSTEQQGKVRNADVLLTLLNGPEDQPTTMDETVTSGSFGEGLSWNYDIGTCTLTVSGNGAMPDFSYDAVNGNISYSPWFDYCAEIKNVVINSGVTNLSTYSFTGCNKLTSISLPGTVTTLGEHCLSGCGLTSIQLPEGVTKIDANAFSSCKSLSSLSLPASLSNFNVMSIFLCSNLTNISVATGNTYYSSAEGVLYSKDGSTILCCPEGKTGNFAIPDGVSTIGSSCFYNCDKLSSVAIPESVITIGAGAFLDCQGINRITIPSLVTSIGNYCFDWDLGSIKFTGNAPKIDALAFDGVTSIIAYYPSNNATWTDDIMQQYGGVITWTEYNPNGESIEPEGDSCRLAELTDVDYLAFSYIAYTPVSKLNEVQRELGTNTPTIRQFFSEEWDEEWKTNITYSELYDHIADWSVFTYDENLTTGLGAYSFINDNSEIVIAYRGSKNPFDVDNWLWGYWGEKIDIFLDWVINDVSMFVGGDGSQIMEAFAFANAIVQNFGSENVHITGHSLGGALCDIVAARYSCAADSFNAAPFLSTAYCYYPAEMGYLFNGVSEWKFQDHITSGDLLAGEHAKELKNYILHECIPAYSGFFERHSLQSMIYKDSVDFKEYLYLTDSQPLHKVSSVVASSDSAADTPITGDLKLGTSTNNTLYASEWMKCFAVYGGNGEDEITSGVFDDTLVGGRGKDELAGRWGDDSYYYFNGDGKDIITDVAGDDVLYLLGFSSSDRITAVSDGDYINISVDGKTVVQIAQDRKLGNHSFKVKIGTGNNAYTKDITDLFNQRNIYQSVVIACPVNVEIIDDATGTVVQTLYNLESSVGIYDTDYGYFYVYPDDEGNYVKAVDLFEGYSVRIVGTGAGTMDVSLLEPDADGNVQIKSAVDVPVTENTIATIEQNSETGNFYLSIDNDGDNVIDQKIQIPNDSEKEIAIDSANFPDAIFREYVKQLDTDSSGGLSKTEQENVTHIEVSSKSISSLEGIQYFVNLTDLICDNNQLTTLDLSSNTVLTDIFCQNNRLTDLDVTNNPALSLLYCHSNQLTELDVSSNPALTDLHCGNNQLTALDLSNNTALVNLDCFNNQLTVLDVSKNINLAQLACDDNQLTGLDLRKSTELTYLSCRETTLKELDICKNMKLTYLQCSSNQLTALDTSKNTALTWLDCINNQLTALDVSKNTALTTFRCFNNQLTELDVRNNTALTWLECSENKIAVLDVSSNTELTDLYCYTNCLTSLNLSTNTKLQKLDASSNVYPIQVSVARIFDLSTLPGSFDTSKASKWVGGTVNGNILTVDADATEVTYTYDCGNGKTVTFTLTTDRAITVSFDANGATGTPPAAIRCSSGNTITVPGVGELEKENHIFNGWNTARDGSGDTLTAQTVINVDITYYAQWTALASYKVKHYQQNLEGVNFTLKDTQTLSGMVGAPTEAAAKSYEGFTAQSIVQKTVVADGTTVVEIYYDRNMYSLNVTAGDGIESVSITIGGENAMRSRAANTVRYGQAVTLDATPKKHHTATGWFSGNDLVSSKQSYSFIMPARTVQLTAKAQLNRYTVTFVADNKVVSTQTVEHGKNAVMPKVPYKFGYTGKWDHDGKNITADTIITAKYTGIMNIDWSNPSTGDYIMIAVAIMVISGAGLATILFLHKRKNKKSK